MIHRKYPEVNAGFLYQSANETRKLMKEASLVLDKFASSKEFGKKVMTAAQESNTKEVERLVKSIGVTSDIHIDYNPDELKMEFMSHVQNTECCKLTVALRWK